MKKISIIIPAFNEQASIGNLLESVEKVRYPKSEYEVVVVNDGSADSTAEVVRGFSGVRLINLQKNVGRYECRKKGAEAAVYPNLLFIDAHSKVDPEILNVLDGLNAKVVNGHALGEDNPPPFETFYIAVRRLIFPKFYRAEKKPFYLTEANFDSTPKGTTVLYIEKEILFSAYRDLAHLDMNRDTSDDTKLLRAIVARESILNHPGVKIFYYSRTSFRASIKHLYERGPRFADYYLNPSLRNFWLVIVFPLLAVTALLIGLFVLPGSAPVKIAALLGLDLAATLILSRSLREVVIIFLLLPLCILVFYAGVLRGVFLKLRQMLNRQ